MIACTHTHATYTHSVLAWVASGSGFQCAGAVDRLHHFSPASQLASLMAAAGSGTYSLPDAPPRLVRGRKLGDVTTRTTTAG